LVYNPLQCNLDPGKIKAHYNSYLAGGHTSVYNPVSIMSAFQQSEIDDFWVDTGLLVMIFFLLFNQLHFAVGQYPLFDRKLPDNLDTIGTIERLLSKDEVSFRLQKSVTFSGCVHSTSPYTILQY
jgi:hypothetical protein